MIRIIEQSREFNEVEQYLMTIAPAIISMKDVEDGEHITVDGILTFEDVKENTVETVEVMSIITPEKQVYSCQSATFKRSISDISNIMKGKPFTVIKTSGKTKAGRDYINCILDVDSLT
nr:MAG TPA: ssDNA binding protein [Caudoviricetes sp.]